MLLTALIMTGIMLGLAFAVFANVPRPGFQILGIAVIGGLIGMIGVWYFPPHILSAVALFIAWVVASSHPGRLSLFVPLALGGTLLAYLLCAGFAYWQTRSLLDRYPVVSMSERLPRVPRPEGRLVDSSVERLEFECDETPGRGRVRYYASRENALKALHEETTGFFLTRPGFGVARMVGFHEYSFRVGEREEEAIPQPVKPGTATWGTDPTVGKPLEKTPQDLDRIHQVSLLDFLHPGGFGYVKDRDHVAGFQPHQFSKRPDRQLDYALRTLELIGLVVHDGPRVYISDNLPRMTELRDAPTRAPDVFEQAGLDAIRGGETLFVRESGEHVRVLGAIRAAKQCVDCHGGQRGDLLGAFSYTLISRK
jgi:hypothetical protein